MDLQTKNWLIDQARKSYRNVTGNQLSTAGLAAIEHTVSTSSLSEQCREEIIDMAVRGARDADLA